MRGHNPKGILSEVLDQHDPQKDYFSFFSNSISKLTGLPHVFPAVSGSTALDLALSLGLVANKGKTKLLTFSENYSGKSLISINATRFLSYRKPFEPLNFDVVEYDPFDEDDTSKLNKNFYQKRPLLYFLRFYNAIL